MINCDYASYNMDFVFFKVRRASAKCLASILGSRTELLSEFYSSVSPKLIARFKGNPMCTYFIFFLPGSDFLVYHREEHKSHFK